MARSILGVVFGIAVGALIVAFVQRIGHLAFPVPDGIDLKDPEQFKTVMKSIPVEAKLAVIASWFAGAFAGAIAALLVARRWAPVAWVTSATLFAMAGMTMIAIPHPFWMILSAVVVFVLGAMAPIKLLAASYTPPRNDDDASPF